MDPFSFADKPQGCRLPRGLAFLFFLCHCHHHTIHPRQQESHVPDSPSRRHLPSQAATRPQPPATGPPRSSWKVPSSAIVFIGSAEDEVPAERSLPTPAAAGPQLRCSSRHLNAARPGKHVEKNCGLFRRASRDGRLPSAAPSPRHQGVAEEAKRSVDHLCRGATRPGSPPVWLPPPQRRRGRLQRRRRLITDRRDEYGNAILFSKPRLTPGRSLSRRPTVTATR